MLITFKSRVCADVSMYEEDGKDILKALGKSPDDIRGVVTVDQLPAAIAALRLAIRAGQGSEPAPPATEDEEESDEAVAISVRDFPVLELLENSLKGEAPVTWGV